MGTKIFEQVVKFFKHILLVFQILFFIAIFAIIAFFMLLVFMPENTMNAVLFIQSLLGV